MLKRAHKLAGQQTPEKIVICNTTMQDIHLPSEELL